MIDNDLATAYAVPVTVFNQAANHNLNRLPISLRFQLINQDIAHLRSQFVSSSAYGGRCTLVTKYGGCEGIRDR